MTSPESLIFSGKNFFLRARAQKKNSFRARKDLPWWCATRAAPGAPAECEEGSKNAPRHSSEARFELEAHYRVLRSGPVAARHAPSVRLPPGLLRGGTRRTRRTRPQSTAAAPAGRRRRAEVVQIRSRMSSSTVRRERATGEGCCRREERTLRNGCSDRRSAQCSMRIALMGPRWAFR